MNDRDYGANKTAIIVIIIITVAIIAMTFIVSVLGPLANEDDAHSHTSAIEETIFSSDVNSSRMQGYADEWTDLHSGVIKECSSGHVLFDDGWLFLVSDRAWVYDMSGYGDGCAKIRLEYEYVLQMLEPTHSEHRCRYRLILKQAEKDG